MLVDIGMFLHKLKNTQEATQHLGLKWGGKSKNFLCVQVARKTGLVFCVVLVIFCRINIWSLFIPL